MCIGASTSMRAPSVRCSRIASCSKVCSPRQWLLSIESRLPPNARQRARAACLARYATRRPEVANLAMRFQPSARRAAAAAWKGRSPATSWAKVRLRLQVLEAGRHGLGMPGNYASISSLQGGGEAPRRMSRRCRPIYRGAAWDAIMAHTLRQGGDQINPLKLWGRRHRDAFGGVRHGSSR